MNRRTQNILAVLAGIVLIIIAVVYWSTPSGSLPSFFPGYSAGGANIHVKHGVASLLLGLVLFAFAWFRSGAQKTQVSRLDQNNDQTH